MIWNELYEKHASSTELVQEIEKKIEDELDKQLQGLSVTANLN